MPAGRYQEGDKQVDVDQYGRKTVTKVDTPMSEAAKQMLEGPGLAAQIAAQKKAKAEAAKIDTPFDSPLVAAAKRAAAKKENK